MSLWGCCTGYGWSLKFLVVWYFVSCVVRFSCLFGGVYLICGFGGWFCVELVVERAGFMT